jgi:hypothetical protein
MAARCCLTVELVKLMGIGPGGKLRDDVEPAKQLAEHLSRIVALADDVEVGEEPLERVLRLADGPVGVVLPLPFEASMMFQQLFAIELAEALTGRTAKRAGQAGNLDTLEATLHGH